MSLEPLETASGSDFPLCRQLSIFVENRLGQLLRLTRLLENTDVSILAVSVAEATDCAVVRLLVNDPDTARETLSNASFAVSESELLVVELPPGKRAIRSICEALIAGEVNMNYIYPLLPRDSYAACLAIQVDDLPLAAAVLASRKFRLLDQSDL
ncbi:MAG: acetolactate synthase [Planctomycetes bacterium]|nr:acetolactate synthase [Planctomycetota bacterium]